MLSAHSEPGKNNVPRDIRRFSRQTWTRGSEMNRRRNAMKRLVATLTAALCILTIPHVAAAAGPGSGQIFKNAVWVGNNCTVDRLTVRWRLGSLMGEPTVSGSYKYSGNCKPSHDFMVWLRVEGVGLYGYVRLNPAVPNGPDRWGFNVTGSPNWNQVLCGYDGTERAGCHEPSTAKSIWKNGKVVDFRVPWRRQ